MQWEKLLSTQKLFDEPDEPEVFSKYPINEFEKDYNRIISSAAFRRLQDKTQVFPLDKSDFVRTRLTHSIETSTIARQLGIMVAQNNTKYLPADIRKEDSEGIPSVLLCAGLLHDLGNPPFGHFGETVIGDWFKENLIKVQYKDKPIKEWMSQQMIADLENFEGNAQALRIVLKAKYNSEINLSAGIISTLVKYPTSSLSFERKHPDIKKHKPGYFFSEEKEFLHVSEIVGTKECTGEIYRHPLTFLLEAADDIAYATADLEDAFKKGLFTLDEFITYFNDSYDHDRVISHQSPEYYSCDLLKSLIELKDYNKNVMKKNRDESKIFSTWLNYTRRWLMYVAVYRFSKSYQAIMDGTYEDDLFKETNHSLTIDILKGAMGEFAYNTANILKLELSAQTILSFLLDKFIPAVLHYDDEGRVNGLKMSKADKKYISLLSSNYRQDYDKRKTGDESLNIYLKLRMVIDYISGMTDSYARTLYRELSGIE